MFHAALDTIVLLDDLTSSLPKGRAYIRDQLRRAANSIVLNIAEGAGEFVPAEKARIYRIARRSATECASQLVIMERLHLMDEERVRVALDELRRVVTLLVRLIQHCRKREETRD